MPIVISVGQVLDENNETWGTISRWPVQ
jgi:hypothetical protein